MMESTVVRMIWGVRALNVVLSIEQTKAAAKSADAGRKNRHMV